GLTQGPADVVLVLGLAAIAAWPGIAGSLEAIVPYAAGFGAAVTFLDMMEGHLPIAAAWLAAMTLAAARDRARPGGVGASKVALSAVAAFSLAAALTAVVKHVLAAYLIAPQSEEPFLGQADAYMGVPESDRHWPGILLPFVRMVQVSRNLTFGRRWAAYV